MRLIDSPAIALALALASSAGLSAAEIALAPVEVVETKAVFGRLETRDLVPARARIGGILVRRDVVEGVSVEQGQVVALVVDEKLALQMRAAEARIRSLVAEQSNARSELERAQALLQRGVSTQQRVDQLRTQVDVLTSQIAAAEAEQAVLNQQTRDGEVRAPVSGRVLQAPVTVGAVVLPGETVVTVAGGGTFLRLALPERHAATLKAGAAVEIGETQRRAGTIAKVFPQIENGRVIVDIEAADTGTYFYGERVMVHIPVARRTALAVPPAALSRRAGLDIVTLVTPAGTREKAVIAGRAIMTPVGRQVEILSGLEAGDRVMVP